MFDTAFIMQQAYQAGGFQQKLFTYALQMPYWQGVLLYYLAVLYPFVAVLVVVPAKARGFLMMPLLWLWVKSWDIGFAIVMVMDKLMWNLLPNSDLPYSTMEFKQGISLAEALPNTMGAALAVDPTYSMHLHYNFTAMALMAVPAITGAVILKGKQSLLAKFTQEPEQAAADAEQLAEGQHGMPLMQKLDYQSQELTGRGLLGLGSFGQGIMATGDASRAIGVATTGTLTTGAAGAWSSLSATKDGWGNVQGVVNEATRAVSNGINGASSILMAHANVRGAQLQGWDDMFGYGGRIASRYQSAMASLDGGGGWEIYNINTKQIGASVWRKEVDQLLTEFQYGASIGGSVADSAARRASRAFGQTPQNVLGATLKLGMGSRTWSDLQKARDGGFNEEPVDIMNQAGIPAPGTNMTRDELYRAGTGPAPFVIDTSKFNLKNTKHA
jgi:hypothetical protein